jgi:hypothetical protein
MRIIKNILRALPIVGGVLAHTESETRRGQLDTATLWGELIRTAVTLLTAYQIIT